MHTAAELVCSLCKTHMTGPLHLSEEEDELAFCCKGCQTVYHILKAQGSVESFQEHPVYQQALQAGLITNPHLHFSKQDEDNIPSEDFQKLHLTIENMWCPSCAQVIQWIVLKEKGVRQCIVDYTTDVAIIEYTARYISKEKILRLISQLGYETKFLQDPRQNTLQRAILLRFIIAAFFSLNVMMFSYPIYATYFDGNEGEGYAKLFAWLSLFCSLPVLIYSASPIWRRFYIALKVRIWGMETLVALGVITAMGISLYELYRGGHFVYFDSMTVIVMFVLLGKIIETRAKFSAKDALIQLSMALPRRGRKRLPSGESRFVPIKEIFPGDNLIVRMGEKIVLDGTVIEGSGICDESIMTGESLPVAKEIGSTALAGTILQQGSLIIRVATSISGTVLQNIVDMVGEELEKKSREVRIEDRIVKWFIPIVVCLALFTGITTCIWNISDDGKTVIQTAFVRAVSVLLISCPCAIGIAVPLVEASILNVLAKCGIIVRNRNCLALLGRETIFVFDKTGTITEGKFRVCHGLDVLSFEHKIALKGLTAESLHPIAFAIHQSLLCPSAPFEKIEELIGKGIRGIYQEKTYFLGSFYFLSEQGILLNETPAEDSESILTTVYFAQDKNCLAVLVLGDQIRSGVKEFIRLLGSEKTLLISGDAASPVRKVAQECHIREWHAGCHPLEKRKLIDQLKDKKEIVAMLGDGVNDAPALSAAQIGIAVVSATDISVQVSDILMTNANFQTLTLLRKVAIKGHKIIKQNLFWAFFYNVIGLGLAMAGALTPLFAAIAMVMSSLMVLFNAQRISRTH